MSAQAIVMGTYVRIVREECQAGFTALAAQLFAIPSVAENGPTLLQIQNQADARFFNSSLPCGAQLVRAESEGDFTIATFRLTERPGGNCGTGTGATAQTSFVIEGSKIAEWRRVGPGSGVVDQAPGRAV